MNLKRAGKIAVEMTGRVNKVFPITLGTFAK
jgi:hypothetical protein